jgi:hypothetical protein
MTFSSLFIGMAGPAALKGSVLRRRVISGSSPKRSNHRIEHLQYFLAQRLSLKADLLWNVAKFLTLY